MRQKSIVYELQYFYALPNYPKKILAVAGLFALSSEAARQRGTDSSKLWVLSVDIHRGIQCSHHIEVEARLVCHV